MKYCLDKLKRWYPNKPLKWIINKHFKESLHPNYNWKWTFTNPETKSQVDRMSWIRIKYSYFLYKLCSGHLWLNYTCGSSKRTEE